ncbi:MAG: ATP synthase F0 subunit C [Candidatus Sumerlaeales bacterium]|nr:ATP synthase F0 subunit C [Candidatus Sumerlaeales bacterium]
MIDKIALLHVAYPVGMGLAAFGCAVGMGRAIASALESSGRQPELYGKLMLLMIIGCALIESLAIYTLLVPFILKAI